MDCFGVVTRQKEDGISLTVWQSYNINSDYETIF